MTVQVSRKFVDGTGNGIQMSQDLGKKSVYEYSVQMNLDFQRNLTMKKVAESIVCD